MIEMVSNDFGSYSSSLMRCLISSRQVITTNVFYNYSNHLTCCLISSREIMITKVRADGLLRLFFTVNLKKKNSEIKCDWEGHRNLVTHIALWISAPFPRKSEFQKRPGLIWPHTASLSVMAETSLRGNMYFLSFLFVINFHRTPWSIGHVKLCINCLYLLVCTRVSFIVNLFLSKKLLVLFP